MSKKPSHSTLPFSAAAHAQRAVDFLHSLQPDTAEADSQLAA